MIDICEFLEVKDEKDAAGVIIEKCSEYNGALGSFVLVLTEDNVPLVKNWILHNMRNNQKHCIMMLEKDPASIFRFLMRMRRVEYCTSEFVHDAGGIQQFIDKYSWLQDSAEPSEDAEAGYDETGEIEIKAESSDFEEAETPAGAETPARAEISEETTEHEEVTASESAPSVNVAREPEQAIAPEVVADVNINQAQATEAQERQTQEASQESVQVLGRKVVIQREIIHKQVREIMDYDPDLIDNISDGQIAESLKKLRELNNQIALDGLDPALVLSDTDLSEVYKKIYVYPPDVFKAFLLAYVRSVSCETERFRLSAVIDDFVNFINGVTA